MTERERKIEAALDDWFKNDDWSVLNDGDHIAVKCFDDYDDEREIIVNLTELAKHIAAECSP